MTTCYFICEENAPDAQEFRPSASITEKGIWMAQRECPESLYPTLSEQASEWTIEEYYTEDDDHGDAFRYFDSETIYHAVTVENAIVVDGEFAGAVFKCKANGSLVPVLIGKKSTARYTEHLSDTHDLEMQSSGRLIRRSDEK